MCACMRKETIHEDHHRAGLLDMAAFHVALGRKQIIEGSQTGRNKIAPVE